MIVLILAKSSENLILKDSIYVQSYLPSPACNSEVLKQFVIEFVQSLSDYFDFEGRIDPTPQSDLAPMRYQSAAEALLMVESLDELSLFSIDNRSFHLLIDLYDDGIELLFRSRSPEADPWLSEFRRLASRILKHLHC